MRIKSSSSSGSSGSNQPGKLAKPVSSADIVSNATADCHTAALISAGSETMDSDRLASVTPGALEITVESVAPAQAKTSKLTQTQAAHEFGTPRWDRLRLACSRVESHLRHRGW